MALQFSKLELESRKKNQSEEIDFYEEEKEDEEYENFDEGEDTLCDENGFDSTEIS